MKWNFKERTNRQYKWETYIPPGTAGSEKGYAWLWATLGKPGPDSGWDYHGGWIKLKGDEEMIMFKLRWGSANSND